MVQSRRDFLKTLGVASLGMAVASCRMGAADRLPREIKGSAGKTPTDLASDESYWATIRDAYELSPDFINIESGYYSPAIQSTIEAQIKQLRRVNREGAFYMRGVRVDEFKEAKAKLAALAGCSPDEITITRNATEALNTIILGIKLEPGEEMIYGDLEYPSMLQTLEMRAKRYGTPVRKIIVPPVPQSKEEIIAAYRNGIGPKTKALVISHMVFLNGLIPPVREIADMAHERGVEVIADGAHSFCHVDYKVPDLHCDYFGTSLHKWLSAPLGTGMLYIKKEKIARVWPFYAELEKPDDSIEKFERVGTRPPHSYIGMEEAIRLHQAIGGANKQARLYYLKNSWVSRVKDLPRIKINSPIAPENSCAICSFTIEGKDDQETANHLMSKHKVFVAVLKNRFGIRVSPNLYTASEHLDRLVMGIRELAV